MRLLLSLVLGGAAAFSAEVPQPLLTTAEQKQVRSAFLAAIDGSPEALASLARWRAASLAAAGAVVLPDPKLWAEGTRYRDSDGLQIGIQQDLPRWGERSAQRAQASAAVVRARVELDQTRAKLAREVSMLVATATASRRRAALADQAVARMRTMVTIGETALAAGGMDDGGVGAVLALRTRIEQMELMAIDERRMASDAEDEARGCCGLDAGAPIPGLLLPELTTLERGADVATRLARAETGLADADRSMARSRRRPMVGVGMSWERTDVSSDEQDWRIGVSLSIPLQQGSLASVEKAAASRAAAAQAEASLADLRIDIALRRAKRANNQAVLAAAAVIAAKQRTEAVMVALREQMAAGVGDAIMRALSRLDDLQEAERTAIAADREAASMTAELWTMHHFPDP